ncbi:MAG: outer membrane beta-barrel protein, partial [Sulfuricurvum sp.]|nr:outer membrane beta-barrel protein [Sulfuricurvum sp.]
MNWIMVWVALLLAETLWGESAVLAHEKPVVKVSGFADMYYVEDYNNPSSDRRQPFLYNHNRHDEPNVNLVLLQVGVEHPNYRSNIGIHTGTY